jgi:flagellar basal-body rod protein FlgC
MPGLFYVSEIAGSGLTAQTLRLEVISNNIANAETTITPQGGPYVRKRVIFTPILHKTDFLDILEEKEQPMLKERGVKVIAIEEDRESPFRREYFPEHPHADKDGYVTYPNVNIILEMGDLISATRAYEANVSAFRAAKQMMLRSLELGR